MAVALVSLEVVVLTLGRLLGGRFSWEDLHNG